MSFIYKIESCMEICIEKCVGRSLTSGSPWGLAILNVSFLHGFFNPFICVFSFFFSGYQCCSYFRLEERRNAYNVEKSQEDCGWCWQGAQGGLHARSKTFSVLISPLVTDQSLFIEGWYGVFVWGRGGSRIIGILRLQVISSSPYLSYLTKDFPFFLSPRSMP